MSSHQVSVCFWFTLKLISKRVESLISRHRKLRQLQIYGVDSMHTENDSSLMHTVLKLSIAVFQLARQQGYIYFCFYFEFDWLELHKSELEMQVRHSLKNVCETSKKKNGIPYTIIFHIGATLIDTRRGWDEPHTPSARSCPWVMNSKSWINSMIFTKDWAPPVFWIRCLCAPQNPVLMWRHVHADVLWLPRTQVSDPLKIKLGCLDLLLTFGGYSHYFLHPATCLYYMALLQIKVNQEMLGKSSRKKRYPSRGDCSNSLSQAPMRAYVGLFYCNHLSSRD